jgi:hypothetical protein
VLARVVARRLPDQEGDGIHGSEHLHASTHSMIGGPRCDVRQGFYYYYYWYDLVCLAKVERKQRSVSFGIALTSMERLPAIATERPLTLTQRTVTGVWATQH